MANKVEPGDFVRVEFTGRIKSSSVVFTTSDEAIAKKSNIFDDKTRYGPIPIVAGQSFLLPGLDKKIIGLTIGEQKSIYLPASEAYGLPREDLIKNYPIRKLKDSGIKPVKGERIKDKNRVGTIVSIKEGRARIDFNHELAGKDLEFDIKVIDKVQDLKSKIFMLVGRYIPGMKEEEFKYESKTEKDISIELSPYLLLTEGLQTVTLRLISELRQTLGYEKIEFKFAFDFSGIGKEEKKLAEALTIPAESTDATIEEE